MITSDAPSRRAAFTGAGMVLAAAMLRPTEASAAERDNVKVVGDFLKAWSAADVTGATLAAFMTPDAEFRFERKETIVGTGALTAAFNAYLDGGKRYQMKPLETHAKGPVVVHFREETPVGPNGAGVKETLLGLFILKGDKIRIWENFLAEA